MSDDAIYRVHATCRVVLPAADGCFDFGMLYKVQRLVDGQRWAEIYANSVADLPEDEAKTFADMLTAVSADLIADNARLTALLAAQAREAEVAAREARREHEDYCDELKLTLLGYRDEADKLRQEIQLGGGRRGEA